MYEHLLENKGNDDVIMLVLDVKRELKGLAFWIEYVSKFIINYHSFNRDYLAKAKMWPKRPIFGPLTEADSHIYFN